MAQAVDRFLKMVQRSGLLTREQLQADLRAVPKDRRGDPQALAEHLVKAGKLSRFQALKLLKGAPQGLILGPFQVLAPIGKGGMGSVYLARDARNGQLVALKVLPPKRARKEERLVARFEREKDLSQRVRHPHLARTYEAGDVNDIHYIAMEYIPGKSLYRLVTTEGSLEVRRAARLFAEVCSALEYAHGQGLIHRDLKPSNILITPNDHAKVLDLGLALMQGETAFEREVIGGAGYIVGSMDYIAPEQTTDATRVDPRADIYGLGCTLYFTLTGKPPFPGGTSLEKIQRQRSEEPVPVTQRNPAVPAAFATIVQHMMAKAPEQRYQTAGAVRQELLAWAGADTSLPVDSQGDQGFQRAVAALRDGQIPPELIEIVIVPSPEPASQPSLATVPGPSHDGSRDLLWLGAAFVGFWVVLLLVLGLIQLLG
ncbi:MAG TPA: serine/threonine-protein kinase [Gemmataceae bacterium]|nr:serine/threonine-protein kinase [Gemmataceae bacterium]